MARGMMRMSRGRGRSRPMRAPRGRPMRPTRGRSMRAPRSRPSAPKAKTAPKAKATPRVSTPSRRGRSFNPMSRGMRRNRGRGMRRGRGRGMRNARVMNEINSAISNLPPILSNMRKVPTPITPVAPQMKNIIMDLDPPYTVAQPSSLVPRPGISNLPPILSNMRKL